MYKRQVVSEEHLSLAIGRRGQNVKLATELTGYEIDILTEDEESSKRQEDFTNKTEIFVSSLDVDETLAQLLVSEGFGSVEEVIDTDKSELLSIEGFDEEIAEELRARAKDALLTRALASEEKLTRKEPAEDLLAMDGMTKQLAEQLCAIDVVTMEDLAEQAVDDLLVIDGLDADKAGQLIMTARAPWFEEETEN